MSTTDAPATIPAAWYPDPGGSPDTDQVRWWDGDSWTEHVRARDALPAPERRRASSGIAERPPIPVVDPNDPYGMFTAAVTTESAGASAGTAVHQPGVYQPMSRPDATAGRPHSTSPVILGSPLTPAIWVYSLLPLAQVAALWILLSAVPDDAMIVARPVILGLLSITAPLCVRSDRRRLEERGFVPPPFLTFLIPLVYFIVRAVRTGARSLIPLAVWLASIVATIPLVLLVVLAADLPH